MNDVEVVTYQESLGVVEVWSGEGALLNVIHPTAEILEIRTDELVGPRGPQGPVGLTGPKGDRGEPGEQGPAGQLLEYVQTFYTPSMVWHIQHDLDAFPVVTTYDLYGFEISGDVAMPDRNTVVVTFAVPFAGTARLKA